jgi:ATP-dependent DNA helicase RecG
MLHLVFERALGIIKSRPGIRVPELSEIMQTSAKNLERWLKQLKEQDQIEFRGAPKTGGYFSKASK